jgi:triosephosphate isomerase
MRRPIIAGNWKMNKSADEAVEFVREIRRDLNAITLADSVICPPFIALQPVAEALQATRIGVGAQNMHYAASGAFTGELSSSMIKPFCQYVILGHSERRAYFAETNEDVNKKVKVALLSGLTPIVCVGESLEQNKAGLTHSFVSDQVQAACAGLSAQDVNSCIFAYEPIWAIGTGLSASVEDAGRIIGLTVRGALSTLFGEDTAQTVRIQYGGSANPGNIGDYMRHPDIDGALVGGASLKRDFVEMVRIAAEVKGIPA